MMENRKDDSANRINHALYAQLLEDIQKSERGGELMGSESLMSSLDIHHKIYFVLGNVVKISTGSSESEKLQSLLN